MSVVYACANVLPKPILHKRPSRGDMTTPLLGVGDTSEALPSEEENLNSKFAPESKL